LRREIPEKRIGPKPPDLLLWPEWEFLQLKDRRKTGDNYSRGCVPNPECAPSCGKKLKKTKGWGACPRSAKLEEVAFGRHRVREISSKKKKKAKRG